MTPAFRRALAHTLKEEGGYANHPSDPGGATMRGVTQATYDSYRRGKGQAPAPVRGISSAELEEIYYRRYWLDGRCDELERISPELALAHFDFAVNAGVRQAAKILQRAAGAADDGVIGPATLAAVRAGGRAVLVRALGLRQRFYEDLARRRPQLRVFLRNWSSRVRRMGEAVGVQAGAAAELVRELPQRSAQTVASMPPGEAPLLLGVTVAAYALARSFGWIQ